MFNAFFILTVFAVTLVLGGLATAWLHLVRRKQLIILGGLKALASMRWREFSRFVIEALQSQGFEASPIERGADHISQGDLRLERDDGTWLLSCKQGANSVVTLPMVAELAKSVRISSASGGIMTTLGQVEPAARKNAHDIELLDGRELWPLVDPLLPPSLHQSLADKAQKTITRLIGFAWGLALLMGLAVGAFVSSSPDQAPPTTPLTRSVPPAPKADNVQSPAAPGVSVEGSQELDENAQRDAVIKEISPLAGIASASWSTRSTLLVNLDQESNVDLVADICTALGRHESLGASRVHLQPPAGSDVAVRFMQCKLY